jgi:lipopolysaccharide biosynthesis glycosyltransferase
MKLEELVAGHENAVLLISDQRYLPAARFVSSQILRQGTDGFDLVVMTLDCTRESQALFDPRVKVIEICADTRLRSLTHSSRKSTATYLRLSTFESLRGIYRKLLYLDCDVWIGRRPIGRLFDIDLEHYEIAAVRDAAEIIRPDSPEWSEYRAKLGLPKDAPYFNTGILLVNVEKFCASAIGTNAISYLAAGNYRGPFHDQSALNCILSGRWLEISPLWNWMFATRFDMTDRYDPGIIHFIGSNKPWSDRKAKHHPKYRAEMKNYLMAFGEEDYVEDVKVALQWRRTVINSFNVAKDLLLGDRRADSIDRFMANTKFADVDSGIVERSW